MNKLFQCYSRLLIDNHISDLEPGYMKKFSPEEYVRNVKRSGVESSMVYACDHNGNCYYPTKIGHQHANLGGRDLFGETVALLKKEGIIPVAYTTVIYHNDCAKRFPSAGILDMNGRNRDGRYRFTCPNQPESVAFYKEQIREIASYDVNGIFIDMTFWPAVCCCSGCRKKYGKPFPEQINWYDPEWVGFQRFRERSMAEFGALLTAEAKSVNPKIAVVHQFSPVLHGWYLGQSEGIADASDYASGDFYGNKLQQRFAVKAFEAYTKHPPYEFMTSRCVNLRDHTSSKPDEELFLSALTTLANGGAYFFIDAINPDGTLSGDFYDRLGTLNRTLSPFKQIIADHKFHLNGKIGLYFSISSCVDNSLNGRSFQSFCGGSSDNMAIRHNAVLDEILGTAEILNRMHIPFRVIKDFKHLEGLSAVIINKAAYLSQEDCAGIREFVRNGGTLIATGDTSLMNMNGMSGGNFQLADVFGTDYAGKHTDTVTYTGNELILAKGAVPIVTTAGETEIREFLTLPDHPVQHPDIYASIHSDPPGKQTEYPAITLHYFGKGKCLWIAAPFLMLRQYTQQEFGKRIFREFLPQFTTGNCNLPQSAELTWLHSDNTDAQLLCIVNYQDEIPVIPLHQIRMEFYSDSEFSEIIRISDGKNIPFVQKNGTVTFEIEKITAGEFFLCIPDKH